MRTYKTWLSNYSQSVEMPEVSGFEILELLEVRSQLALIEDRLKPEERHQLEASDEVFLSKAHTFYKNLAETIDLQEVRAKRNIFPSHWWWYLDKLTQKEPSVAA